LEKRAPTGNGRTPLDTRSEFDDGRLQAVAVLVFVPDTATPSGGSPSTNSETA
jgi:hypothetical protein